MEGPELKRRRAALGMTQVELAKALGVTGNTVARWERDEVRMPEPAARFIMLLRRKKRERR